MSKHTPEPWFSGLLANDETDGDASVLADGRGMVCIVPLRSLTGLSQDKPLDYQRTVENQKANLDRIVACVNAMAGIPNPEAFMAAARKMLCTHPGCTAFIVTAPGDGGGLCDKHLPF